MARARRRRRSLAAGAERAAVPTAAGGPRPERRSRWRTIRAIFARSGVIGQGNPAITEHPVTPEQCRAQARAAGGATTTTRASSGSAAPVHGAALRSGDASSPRTPRPASISSSSPTSPAPTRWSGCGRARRRELCAAMGKRLCDAHEWEGACAGSLEPPDYRFDLADGRQPERRGRAHAHGPQPGARGRQDLELRPRLPRRASAPPPATRARPATAAAGRSAARTPTRPAPSPTATARSASTTSTATPPST